MKWITIAIIVLLIILHQDWWWWESTSLVFGFIPIGLAYHALISILAGCAWAMAIRYLWPRGVDELSDSPASGEAAE